MTNPYNFRAGEERKAEENVYPSPDCVCQKNIIGRGPVSIVYT